MIFIVLGGLVLKIRPLLGGLSFRDSLFAPTPPIFRIAATRKRNGVEISNSQNFLVSMISTSILNKKKIHDIGCTPLFELGWNDPRGYSRWISGGILGSRKLPLLRKSYTHCMISNYQHTSVNQIVIARNCKPLCSDLPFKMRWFRPSNPIKCAVIDCQNYRLSE